ncbi:hypothetical protein ACK367_08910 [Aeromonas veronii]
MIDQWPWFVMGTGVVGLFAYRYWRSTQRSYLYSPTDFKDVNEFLTVRSRKTKIVIDSAHDQSSTKQTGVLGDSNVLASRDVSDQANARKVPQRKTTALAMGHNWMPVVISLLVLLSALFVILSNNNFADAEQKWAFGVVGTILGYWFKK